MKIEVFQDLICPWCRIGNQNLKDALKKWVGEPATVQYRTFLLNPGTPENGLTFDDYMKAKGAGNVKYDDFIKPIISAGEKIGLNFNFDGLGKIASTILGHRFLHLLPDEKKSKALDLLHLAYFEEGQDISDINILMKIAKDLDMDPELLKNELNEDGGKEDAIMDFYYAIQVGVKGVPLFIFDNKAVLYGAQSTENILSTMKKAEQLPEPVSEESEETS
ncbi:MAG: DsbA family oxidoreductase [Candidatus Kariarchaeaceae archaeon]|jgi:predicted DsbA family dithiol-disulfide isomerase